MGFASDFLVEARRSFLYQKRLAERALEQLPDADLFRTLGAEENSVAVIMKHISGNLRSRWTDFLTSDGEKPDRKRDQEFVIEAATTRQELMEHWAEGWQRLFQALDGLHPEDLGRTVTIRGEAHTVVQAISRALGHYANHVGQIVLLAKHFRGSEWRTLSIPRGDSEEFRRRAGSYLKSHEE